jgi:hypothetical protein
MIILNGTWTLVHHTVAVGIATGKVTKKKKFQAKIGMYFASRSEIIGKYTV